jgi:hypothetical protein
MTSNAIEEIFGGGAINIHWDFLSAESFMLNINAIL